MLDKIFTFITVVEKGSFILAAQALGTSQSHVSRSISALEDQIGVKLLNRSTKGITLTEFGQNYYAESILLANRYNDLEILCSSYARELSGEIKILAAGYVVNSFVLKYIHEFAVKYNKVKIHLEVAEKTINFKTTDVDVSFSPSVNIDSVPENRLLNIKTEFMFNSRFTFYASTEYLNKHGMPKTIDELMERTIITHAGRVDPDVLVLSDKKFIISPKIYTNNASVNAELTYAGLGIVQILDAYIPDRLKPSLVEVLPEYGYDLTTYMYSLKERENEPIISAFTTFVMNKILSDSK